MITKQGTIVGKSGDKTVKVRVIDYVQHPKYKKQYPKTTNFLVHDETNSGEIGATVTIAQDKKVSKRKSWKLVANPSK